MSWIDVPQAPGAQRATTARNRADASHGWYRIRNAADTAEAELFLFDEIGGWFGATADQFVEDLAGVTAPSLRVRVNSPGGSVFEGLAIANALRAHPANVTVQVDGLAASIASVIAMAADRVVMFHEASGVCLGDSAEMAKMAEVLDIISSNIADAYAAKAGGDADTWRAAMREETWYKAADAVKAGLADEALPANGGTERAEDEPAEMHACFDLAAYGYNGPPVPKPSPPRAQAPEEQPVPPVTLTISLGDAVGEQIATALRDAVFAPADPPVIEPIPPEPAPDPAPEPAPAPVPVGPADGWGDLVARLTTPPVWADLTSHLTNQPSSAATTA